MVEILLKYRRNLYPIKCKRDLYKKRKKRPAAKERKIADGLSLRRQNYVKIGKKSLEICKEPVYYYTRQKFDFRQYMNNGGQQND